MILEYYRLDIKSMMDLVDPAGLTMLVCNENQLTALDVSNNTALTTLYCNNNQLTYLNMKNGVTDQLEQFNATNNSLDCIEVNEEDIAWATENWTYENGNIDEGVEFSVVCAPEGYTYVPDDNFEQALIDLGYDDTLDDFVLTENISGVTELNVNSKEISDLTGIEDFTALTYLSCGYNQLTSLDVSSNTALISLYCEGNSLTSLDLSNNTALEALYCTHNYLTSLDLSNNTALTYLVCYDNSFCCIQLDPSRVSYANQHWDNTVYNSTDNGVIFSDDCGSSSAGPVIISAEPDDVPEGQEEISITAEISDENGIDGVTLHYRQGGSSGYTSVAMSGGAGSFTGTIPGSAVTMNGLLYYIVAQNALGISSTSDIFCIEVGFNSGSITTSSLTGSAYPSGLPMDKWRLISVPAVLDNSNVSQVIGDELGTQDNNVWRLYEYDEGTGSFNDNPAQFTPGDSYWLYQRVGNNLSVSAPAGETGDMCGTYLTIRPGWNLIGSPYPFSLPLVLDPVQFYGCLLYTSDAADE